MASIRTAKSRAQQKQGHNIILPNSKLGAVGRWMNGSKPSTESARETRDYPIANIPDRIGNAQRIENKAVTNQQTAIVNTIDKQLSQMASMMEAQRDMIALQEANQKSEDWLASKTKFKTETTSLFPGDLKAIRKLIQEELAKTSGGGFGGMIPGAGGGKSPNTGGGTKPKGPSKARVGIGMVGKAAIVGGAYTAYTIAEEHINEKRDIESQYRAGEITAEERAQKEKEINYKSGGAVAGGVGGAVAGKMVGAAAGGVLGGMVAGPLGAVVGRAAGGWLGAAAGGFIGSQFGGDAAKDFAKTPVAAAASAATNGSSVQATKKAQADITKSSNDAINAINRASQQLSIPRDEMLAVAMQESSMNPLAPTKKSNAVGLFQFLPSTWDNLIKANGKFASEHGISRSNSSGNDDRTDAYKSALMYGLLRKESMGGLGNASTGDKSVDAYIMHLLGGPVGKKVIRAFLSDPNTKISEHVSSAQYNANKDLMEKSGRENTVAEFVVGIRERLTTKSNEAQNLVKKSGEKFDIDRMDSSTDPRSMRKGEEALQDAATISKGVDVNRLESGLKDDLTGLANDYKNATGNKIQINSAYRSTEQQAALYAQNPEKVAKPGTSMHELGMASDINTADANKAASLGLLAKNGLTRPIASEPWHIESEGARNMVKKKSDSEERIAMTKQVNEKSMSGGGAPVIVNNSTQPNQPSVRQVEARPQVALTTRNNDSTYQALKLQEASRMT
jgi:uncharacterized protein YcbK (DUF882 family)